MVKSIWYCPICYLEGSDPEATRCPEDGTPLASMAQREQQWIGKVIDGKYQVVGLLGTGGMAEVFEVKRISSDKRLALKLLKSAFTRDPQIHTRFRQEAMLISLIAHRNIVTLEDFGVLEENANYMVMELLNGYSLGEALRMGPMAPETAFQIMLQACEGMAAAHERGVIHRDLKPDNIFIQTAPDGKEPVVKILDLGIGKLFNNTAAKGLTMSGTVVGTPEYMSPEQCKGIESDAASDIYSLGIVLYEMLFGVVPFEDESPLLVLPRQISEPPPWDATKARMLKIPADTRRVVLKALEKSPLDRHESMLDLQRDIAGLLSRVRRGGLYTLPSIETVKQAQTAAEKNSATLPATDIASDAADGQSGSKRSGNAIQIVSNVYWVGRRHGSQLECNPYLRVFEGNGHTISLLIDPGPVRDLDIVTENISSVIGSIQNLNYIFINHQDPDVAGNAAEIQRINPGVMVICSEDTWRLARHYGLATKRYISTESIPGQQIGFNTGHFLRFIPTPFCHSRGAVMVYDPESRVLFSGDLFGGTSRRTGYIYTSEDEDGIQLFHQVYMPSRRALRRAVEGIFQLHPFPQVIAPQHGHIITDDNVNSTIQLLKELPVGMDLIEANERSHEMLALANEVLRTVASIAGKKALRELLDRFGEDQNLVAQFEIVEPGRISAFKIDSAKALSSLFSHAEEMVPQALQGTLHAALESIRKRAISSITPYR